MTLSTYVVKITRMHVDTPSEHKNHEAELPLPNQLRNGAEDFLKAIDTVEPGEYRHGWTFKRQDALFGVQPDDTAINKPKAILYTITNGKKSITVTALTGEKSGGKRQFADIMEVRFQDGASPDLFVSYYRHDRSQKKDTKLLIPEIHLGEHDLQDSSVSKTHTQTLAAKANSLKRFVGQIGEASGELIPEPLGHRVSKKVVVFASAAAMATTLLACAAPGAVSDAEAYQRREEAAKASREDFRTEVVNKPTPTSPEMGRVMTYSELVTVRIGFRIKGEGLIKPGSATAYEMVRNGPNGEEKFLVFVTAKHLIGEGDKPSLNGVIIRGSDSPFSYNIDPGKYAIASSTNSDTINGDLMVVVSRVDPSDDQDSRRPTYFQAGQYRPDDFLSPVDQWGKVILGGYPQINMAEQKTSKVQLFEMQPDQGPNLRDGSKPVYRSSTNEVTSGGASGGSVFMFDAKLNRPRQVGVIARSGEGGDQYFALTADVPNLVTQALADLDARGK